MFSVWDHLLGAITVRIHRFLLILNKEPDAVFVSHNLFFGGYSTLISLKKIGITSILDLTENQQNKNLVDKFSIQYYGLSIPDRGVPTIDQALDAVKWIQNKLESNDKVFVHCNLGRGRGPLLTALYLLYAGMNKKDALELLRKKRSFVFLNPIQNEFLDLFQKNIS